MRHRKVTPILDRKAAARKALLTSLAQSVILYEKVKTTKAKAKAVRPLLERAIHMSKDGSLNSRRYLLGIFSSKIAVNKTLESVGPRYKDRNGGYTRITAIGHRQGDGADMVQIELV